MAQESGAVAGARNGEAEHGGAAKAVVFTALKPQLVVEASKASDAVQFYKAAFGAEELKREMHTKRKAEHELPLILKAELKVGSSVFVVADHSDSSPALSGGSLWLETNDVEGAVAKAVKAGAVAEGEIAEGESIGKVKDPYGYFWLICSAPANVEA
ncbi:hypothetical protein Sjap_009130 [Stephania japonica]|uniref:VOC domain-containing protein n=1 Tax=Stephania japonica TaxID=461633 RepID=A0AAP0PF53_9MAGN